METESEERNDQRQDVRVIEVNQFESGDWIA
jgi:hypothetical protein